jgi:hypothetical protein
MTVSPLDSEFDSLRPLPPPRIGSTLRCGTPPLSASAWCPKTTILSPSSNRRFR